MSGKPQAIRLAAERDSLKYRGEFIFHARDDPAMQERGRNEAAIRAGAMHECRRQSWLTGAGHELLPELGTSAQIQKRA